MPKILTFGVKATSWSAAHVKDLLQLNKTNKGRVSTQAFYKATKTVNKNLCSNSDKLHYNSLVNIEKLFSIVNDYLILNWEIRKLLYKSMKFPLF